MNDFPSRNGGREKLRVYDGKGQHTSAVGALFILGAKLFWEPQRRKGTGYSHAMHNRKSDGFALKKPDDFPSHNGGKKMTMGKRLQR